MSSNLAAPYLATLVSPVQPIQPDPSQTLTPAAKSNTNEPIHRRTPPDPLNQLPSSYQSSNRDSSQFSTPGIQSTSTSPMINMAGELMEALQALRHAVRGIFASTVSSGAHAVASPLTAALHCLNVMRSTVNSALNATRHPSSRVQALNTIAAQLAALEHALAGLNAPADTGMHTLESQVDALESRINVLEHQVRKLSHELKKLSFITGKENHFRAQPT